MANRNWWENSEQLQLFYTRLQAIRLGRRHFLQVVGAAGGASAVALALEACGGGEAAPEQPAATSPSGPAPAATRAASPVTAPSTEGNENLNLAADQTFRINSADEPLSFDFNENLYCLGDPAVFAQLLQFDPLLQVQPDVAETWEANEDQSVWTFHLRQDTKWSNGDPVTAHDYEWSFKRQLDPATEANYAGFLYDLKNGEAFNNGQDGITRDDVGVRATDDYTLVCELEGPRGYFPVLAAYTSAAPAHRASVEQYGDQWTEAANIVCNGSYTLVDWQHNRSFTLKKNPGYWNAQNITVETVFEPIIDATGEFLAYQNNEIDLALRGSIGNLAQVQSDPVLSKEYFKYNLQGTWYLAPSFHLAPFDDKNVRLALNHAIDRDTIVNQVLSGLGTPAYTMINPGMPGYDPNRYDEFTSYDPELALSLLQGTPYEGGRNWPEIVITMRNNEGDAPVTVAQAIAAMLTQNLGMNNIEVRPGDPTTTYQLMYQHRVQLMWVRWYIDYPDPNNDMYLVWYSQISTGQRHEYSNEEFDRLVAEAAAMPNGPERWQKYYDANQLMISDGAATFVYNPYNYGLIKPWVAGMPTDQDGNLVPNWNVFLRMYDYLKILEH